jgi:hypothetical protein
VLSLELSPRCVRAAARRASRISVFVGPPPLRGSFFLENGTLRDTREKNPEIGSKKKVTLHYSSESNYKI